MEEQMNLFEDGGLNDEGGKTDEVSGNDVPSGSTRKEVRDDIPAMLSEGEFVLPADVVRYHGLEKIMQLRDEAKFGLRKMEAMGQMGNSEEATLDDDIPFGPADLVILAGEPMEGPEEPREMAEGGVVKAQAGTFVPASGIMGYQPSIYQGQQTSATYTPPPSSVAPPAPTPSPAGGYLPKFVTNQTTPFDDGSLPPPPSSGTPTGTDTSGVSTASTEDKFVEEVQDKYTSIKYINPETGEMRDFYFYNGNPVTPIPEGFVPYDETTDEVVDDLESTAVETTLTQPTGDGDQSDGQGLRTAGTGTDVETSGLNFGDSVLGNIVEFGLEAVAGVVNNSVIGLGFRALTGETLTDKLGLTTDDGTKEREGGLTDVSGDGRISFGDTALGDLIGLDGKFGIQGPGIAASIGGARRGGGDDTGGTSGGGSGGVPSFSVNTSTAAQQAVDLGFGTDTQGGEFGGSTSGGAPTLPSDPSMPALSPAPAVTISGDAGTGINTTLDTTDDARAARTRGDDGQDRAAEEAAERSQQSAAEAASADRGGEGVGTGSVGSGSDAKSGGLEGLGYIYKGGLMDKNKIATKPKPNKDRGIAARKKKK